VSDARAIVERYQQAFGGKDFETARSLLADDLEFRGPIDTFHSADDYLAAIRRLSAIVEGVEVERVFADGDDVAIFYGLVTSTPAGTAPVAEWYRVRDAKIAEIRVYFDARPFAPPS
jgi:ketosteroid isomerase-like protein